MIATFVLADDPDPDRNLVRHDIDTIPAVDESIEIKGVEYIVQSRRWKSGRLGLSVVVTVRAALEAAQ